MKLAGIDRTIHSRASWGAHRPKARTPQSPHDIRELFIHWPGNQPRSWARVDTPKEEEKTMLEIQEFHMGPERGWSDFAYSFGVFASGRIYRGRGLNYVPAAQLGHNTGTAAVVAFVGPEDHLTEKLTHSLEWLVKFVERRAAHEVKVRPHHAVTSTECPGPRLSTLVPHLDRV